MTLTAPGPGPHLPPRPPALRWRRRGQLGGVLLAVLAGHAWLIGPVRTPLGRPPEHSTAIQLVTLPSPAAAPLPAEGPSAGPEAVPEPPPPPAPPAEEPPTPPRRPDDRPIDWTAGPRPPESVTGTEPPEPEASAPPAPTPGLVGDAQSDEGGPPPTYRTVPPAQTFKLDYRIERGDDAGVGQLSFQPLEGGQYTARLSGVIDNKALLDWVSRGSFDDAGVAPQRMAEHQRGLEVRAVNFQRDKSVISFSSSTRAFALFGGAQDRVSLLLQLVAIAEAQPGGGLRPGQRIRLQVAGSRGQATDWVFEVLGDERIEPNGSPIDTVHLQREPTQPYDQRVEVWLARAAGHLPVGLRFTTVPGKESTAFWLSGPLPVAAGTAASAARP
ncbi:MAG TPA: DUF3108 domain-containing protein [Ideonella sp.]|jgi:hypothetical protein|nr:DUF3108 domain-containing protein [Ideonella sp.]